jgi:DNA-binding MarR family transcriptional regulator
MGTERSLSRELADMALILMGIIKQEFKSGAEANAPTLTQFKMLYMIKGGIRHVGKLCEAFGISQPATSKMVDVMVKEGLLKRVPHPGDRRQIELRLTAKASASIDAIYKRAFAKIDRRLERLPAKRKKMLAKQMREISNLLSFT